MATDNRRYSLIVLTFNRPGPLARCLDSIANLEWSGLEPEVVVIDDGSEPPADTAIASHLGRGVKYVWKANGGVSSARNAGLDATLGSHVAFIADDYVLPPSYLSDVDAFFAAHPDADMISFAIDPRGPSLLRPVQRLYLDLAIAQEVAPAEVGKEASQSFTLPASRAAVFRRTLFDRIGRFDERLTSGEDGEFGNRMAKAGVPVHVFLRKRVGHYDAISGLDYLRQRLRYGRSYLRAGTAGPARTAFAQGGTPALSGALVARLFRKFGQWWAVSGRLGIRVRFVALAPFLLGFLLAFYFGAYLELRLARRPAREEKQ